MAKVEVSRGVLVGLGSALGATLLILVFLLGRESGRRAPTVQSVDLSGAAHRIRVPTLVVAGRGDQLVPVADVSQTAAAIPGARFEIIDGADHFDTIGNDARVMPIVSAFLAEATRGR